LFIEPAPASPESHEPRAFIPPQPERMPQRGPRMPRIDELPVPAQNELRARRGETPPEEHHPQRRHVSLLQRLAAVGLGRREHDEQDDSQFDPRAAAPIAPPSAERLPGRPMPRAEARQETRPETRQEARQDHPVSEYAKRPNPQTLDQHGRQQTPVHNHSEEDQLDIPAFLRRQAN
jgi:cell division protein FtsZ